MSNISLWRKIIDGPIHVQGVAARCHLCPHGDDMGEQSLGGLFVHALVAAPGACLRLAISTLIRLIEYINIFLYLTIHSINEVTSEGNKTT